MANKKHLTLLKGGVETWNAWRRANPRIRPSLSGATLFGATLCGADLREADLRGADLSYANLRGADLFWASLGEADLTRANLSYADLRGTGLDEAQLTNPLGWLAGMGRSEAVGRQRMDASGVAS